MPVVTLVIGQEVIFLLIFAFLHVVIFFTIKHILLEKTPYDLGISRALLNNTLKAHAKFHGIKTKSCDKKKKNFPKVKMDATNGEKHIINKELISKIYKECSQISNKRTKIQLENRQEM